MSHSDIIVVQLLSRVQLFVTPWTAACHTSLSFTISWSLFKLMFIEFESVMHPTISSSVISFSSFPQSFPASGSFPMSQLFTSGGQSIGASASASVLPVNIQRWFPLGLTDLIFLLSKGLSRVFSSTTIWKHQFFLALSLPYDPTLTSVHGYWTNWSLTIWTFIGKVMFLLFNMLSRFDIAFLPRSKDLFNFMAAVTICSIF